MNDPVGLVYVAAILALLVVQTWRQHRATGAAGFSGASLAGGEA